MTKKVNVSSTEQLVQALAAGYTAENIVIDNAAAVAQAKADGIAEGKASAAADIEAARTASADTERARIAAIQKIARPGFETVVQKGINDRMSAADVALAIMTEAADRGITLDAIRKDSPSAGDRAPPPADDKTQAQGKSWDQIQTAASKNNRM